mmetsp:Transcript_27465/g.53486  ORF Transcript_27465/g.53486 Transcript_27465/m.53486 type:complete len:251 (-) Transcript_27465:148-900(-)
MLSVERHVLLAAVQHALAAAPLLRDSEDLADYYPSEPLSPCLAIHHDVLNVTDQPFCIVMVRRHQARCCHNVLAFRILHHDANLALVFLSELPAFVEVVLRDGAARSQLTQQPHEVLGIVAILEGTGARGEGLGVALLLVLLPFAMGRQVDGHLILLRLKAQGLHQTHLFGAAVHQALVATLCLCMRRYLCHQRGDDLQFAFAVADDDVKHVPDALALVCEFRLYCQGRGAHDSSLLINDHVNRKHGAFV